MKRWWANYENGPTHSMIQIDMGTTQQAAHVAAFRVSDAATV